MQMLKLLPISTANNSQRLHYNVLAVQLFRSYSYQVESDKKKDKRKMGIPNN
jgi:hypothetical protein